MSGSGSGSHPWRGARIRGGDIDGDEWGGGGGGGGGGRG